MRHEQNPLPGEAPGPPGRPPLPGPVHGVGGALHPGPPWCSWPTTPSPTTTSAFTLENIQRFFVSTSTVFQEDGSSQEVRTYLLIFWRSLKLAIISHPGVPGAGLSPGLHHGSGQAPHPEDLPHHHHDPHVDELPHPHLRLDDHSPGHGDLQQLPHPPPPAQHPHHRHGGRRGHRHGL